MIVVKFHQCEEADANHNHVLQWRKNNSYQRGDRGYRSIIEREIDHAVRVSASNGTNPLGLDAISDSFP